MDTAHTPMPAVVHLSQMTDATLLVQLAGNWQLRTGVPELTEIQQQLDDTPRVRQLTFEVLDMPAWDTGLLTFLLQLLDHCQHHQIAVDQSGLPEGVRRLLALATAVPEREGARRGASRLSWLGQVGTATLTALRSAPELFRFIGEACLTFVRFSLGKARYRRTDLVLLLQECGAQALGIVTLISFLVGLILAFMGAVQLRQFGAQIYVADLVGLGMTREMGAIMTGVIIAGRTGAAFAAQLGTMQVNEEIDALITMGIPPMEFLVLPRMLALMLMMPLLCVFADMVGMLAGLVVATGLLDMTLLEYVNETQRAVHLVDCGVGLFKSVVFGALVALAGCLRGMQCGRSAASVGAAATSAVVTGIVWIIASDGVFAVLTERLGL
jgi:phospholipid/cholesterol/gamma-HCH transport system permease protein